MSFDILRNNNQEVRRFIYPTGSNKSRFWCPQRSTLEQIMNYLYDPTGLMSTTPPENFWKNIGSVFFGADPQNAILSLRLYPCNFSNVNTTTFSILGQTITDSQGHLITCEEIPNNRLAWVYDLGHYDIPYFEDEDSFLSYDPYTKLFVYLPFASLLELDTKRYVGKTLQINAIIDFYNGDLYYLLSTTEDGTNYTYIEQVKTHIAVDMPMYKGSMFDIARNTLHSALKLPLEMASAIQSYKPITANYNKKGKVTSVTGGELPLEAPSIANTLLETEFVKNQMMYGNLDGIGSFVSPLKCNIIMYRPKIKYHLNDTSYNHLYGVPCKKIKLLSGVGGYTKIDGVHIRDIIGATDEELREIEKILFDGFINNAGTATLPISYSGSHITWTNTSTSITYGQSYSTTAVVETGYQLDSLQVLMGGVDITATAVSGNHITIPSVTGRLTITAVTSKIPVTYTITYTNLVGADLTNTATTIQEGTNYLNTLLPKYNQGYYKGNFTPTITMGGVVLSNVYNNGVINIPNVQGNIVIIGALPQSTNLNADSWTPKYASISLYDGDEPIMNLTGEMYKDSTQCSFTDLTIDTSEDITLNNSFIYGVANISGVGSNILTGLNSQLTISYESGQTYAELGKLTSLHLTTNSAWTNYAKLLEWLDNNFDKVV